MVSRYTPGRFVMLLVYRNKMELNFDFVNYDNIVCIKAEYFDETIPSGGLGNGLHCGTCRKLCLAFSLMQ